MNIQHANQIENAIKAVKEKNAQKYFFVACGGSMSTLQAAQYIFEKELTAPSFTYTSKEFIVRNPKCFDKDSVVILCSHSGKTPETAQAAKFARDRGALTIAFSNVDESPLSQEAEYNIHYDWGQGMSCFETLGGILFRVVFGILNVVSPCEKYERAIKAVEKLDDAVKSSIAKHSEQALEFAKNSKREELFYAIASGILYPEAYSLAACFLTEMQWIHAACYHSGELFHGPFEVADYDVPYILFKNLGDSRVMDDRAEAFLTKITDKLTVIDAENFDMSGIDEDLKEYFAQPIAMQVIKSYIVKLGDARGHLMSVRRYMGLMDY